ncbi:MAG: hypothetical protein O7D34_02460 [Ignavibacteria bacterium]|nr:hypothetical protein [Ignavibacteria bacterium]
MQRFLDWANKYRYLILGVIVIIWATVRILQGGSPEDLLNIFLEPTTMFAGFVVCTALVLAIKTKYWPTPPMKLGQFIR